MSFEETEHPLLGNQQVDQVSLVEKAIQEAAMRESGYYCLSARELEGFALAEITIYGVPHDDHNVLRNEIENMCHQLDVLCFA